MKKRRRKTGAAVLVRMDVLDQILYLLKETDQKLEYLIKNLRRFNGHQNHLNHSLSEFMN